MKKENETSLSLLKRFALTILCLLSSSIASVWTGANSEPSTTKTIGGRIYYVINNADELAWFASQVNNGQTTINAFLNDDIFFESNKDSVSKFSWNPIGISAETAFNGIFEGNNHGVYGILSNKRNESIYGFFGVIGENGIVRNLLVKGDITNNNEKSGSYSYTSDVSGLIKIYLGGIAAINYGSIENSHAFGSITDKLSHFAQNVNGGGVVGWNYGSLKNVSSNHSIVSSYSFSYGISSRFYILSGSCGGIVGTNEGLIENSTNNSPVKPSGIDGVGYGSRGGGIAGVNTNNGIINKSVNKGDVVGRRYIGGVVGSNDASIYDCINEGNISNASDQVGSLVGGNSSTGILKTSYSATNSFLVWSQNRVGAIIGENYGIVNTAYYDSDVLADFPVFGSGSGVNASGKATSDMQKDQFAWILNTTNGSEDNSGVWSRYNGYPVFANDTLLAIRKIVFDDGENTVIYYTNYKGLIPQLPDVPKAPEGKAFAGWIDTDGKTCDINTVFSKDQTIAASFLDWDDVLYTIQFIGSNGKTLDVVSVHAGEIPEYTGAIPTKTATKAYRYTFNKWSPDLTAATWHKSYEASFDSTLIPYKVTFKDYDGTELNSTDVDFGTKPSYSAIPKRAMTDEYIYTFRGWYPAVELVSDVATYTATYDSTLREYQITFKNGDVTLQSTNVAYGTKPGLLEGVPTKAATKQWTYTFKGWTPEIANVSETMTYTAVFDSSLNKYMVAFVSGASTLQSSEVAYGTVPEFSKSEPTKTSTAKYDYTFKAWTPTLTKVVDDATYIAAFDSTIRSYEITFQNGKNTLQSEPIEFGKTPVYSGETPTKMESEGYTYTFAGWEPAVVSVSDKAVYIASFDSVAKKFDVVFMNEKDTLSKQSVEYGVVPKYTGSNPSKKNSEKYEYNFIGWNEEISAVVKEAVYTAKFDSTEIKSESLTQIRGSNVSIRAVGGKQIALNNLPFGQKFYVMDMQGRVVNQGVTSMSNTLISVNSVGRYIVKTNNLTQLLNVR